MTPIWKSQGPALDTRYIPDPIMLCSQSFATPKHRGNATLLYIYTHILAEPIARTVQYISRLLDGFRCGIPVFLLDCFARKRKDASFEAVVQVWGEDDVFVLVAVGKLFAN